MAGQVRLSELGLRSYVSQSGLAAVLRRVKETGLPDAISRRSIKRSRDKAIRVDTANGPLFDKWHIMPEGSSNPVVLEFIKPAAWLSYMCQESEGYSQMLHARHTENPSSLIKPWRLALYIDEITPGNNLRHDNQRKVQAVYWSWLELGLGTLSQEISWNLLTVLRSTTVTDLGGVSKLFKFFLEAFFNSPDFRSGVVLQTRSGPMVLCAALQVIIADEAALKSIFEHKGASGLLPCILCKNCTLKRSELHEHDRTGFLVSMTEHRMERFVPNTDADVQASLHHLASKLGTMRKGNFEKLESALGLNYNPSGLLCSPWFPAVVSPQRHLMYDWMHCYLVNGIFNLETGMLLGRLHAIGITHATIHSWMSAVVWPSHIKNRGITAKSVFQKRGGGIHDSLKCSASEGLSTYGPLRFFLTQNVILSADTPADMHSAVISYYALAVVMDKLLGIVRGTTSPNDLSSCIPKHCELFKLAYGEENVIPKFHYAGHLGDQFKRHGILLNCFVHERKHREVKRFANELSNTASRFEANVLEGCLLAHIEDLKTHDDTLFGVCLVNPKLADPELTALIRAAVNDESDVFFSHTARFNKYQSCSGNDLIVLSYQGSLSVAEVWFHVSISRQVISCVSVLQPMGNNKFRRSTEPALVATDSIQFPCSWLQSNSEITECYIVPATC